ncbi:carbohydrate ABC transporter permease [Ruania suaedae]|uniref:carbohydrate ABC transporter permease n=1 Tax=Ruania suaedae TaxID=2897774 RepID=UPI001E34455C|nr:carbohydrate ABC transporter permease [Ruania suaedae]UFU02859.1 carbohydrate ABC transporter permease [Ruania suaedae]
MSLLTRANRVMPRRSLRHKGHEAERSIISPLDRRRPATRAGLGVMSTLLLSSLLLVAGGPLLWLAKSAFSTTQDIIADPFTWWPSGIQWTNLADAWSRANFDTYFLNTVWIAVGSWAFSLIVAVCGGYSLSVLRPSYGKYVNVGVLATLFIPGVISLVPLYITVLDLPLVHINLLNTYWAVWLPAAASAFNVLLVTRFFDGLPRDIFDAAKIDGAGAFGVFWLIVIPLSQPIIATVSLLSIMAAWKEFLWPFLVLPSRDLQPLSVGLYRAVEVFPLNLQIAGMFISVIVPLIVFMLFQRQFLKGVGQSGALKG